MNKPQVIHDGTGKPAFAVIPWSDYESLVGADADAILSDEELHDLAIAADEESFPMEVVDRLLAGENPIAVFRRHRGMRQRHLAEAVGINPVYLSQIERGKRNGSTRTLAAIAAALRVDLDDLLPRHHSQ